MKSLSLFVRPGELRKAEWAEIDAGEVRMARFARKDEGTG